MKAKNYRVESLSEQAFRVTKAKFLKKRLKQLKKKPKKNQLGISRIQGELDRRLEEEINNYIEEQEELDRLLDEIDREFNNDEIDEEEPYEEDIEELITEEDFEGEYEHASLEESHNEALQRVREMRKVLENKVRNEPDFALRVRTDSNKLKVLAELRYINDDRIYGYMVQNISPELLELEHFADEKYLSFMAGNSREVLCTGEVRIIELTTFVAMMAQQEFSFTVANGYIKSSIPLEEVLRQEKETGRDIILSNYRVVPKKDAEPIPIIYIE